MQCTHSKQMQLEVYGTHRSVTGQMNYRDVSLPTSSQPLSPIVATEHTSGSCAATGKVHAVMQQSLITSRVRPMQANMHIYAVPQQHQVVH
jgi:hypothetical protein